jgi:hypothetical protein
VAHTLGYVRKNKLHRACSFSRLFKNYNLFDSAEKTKASIYAEKEMANLKKGFANKRAELQNLESI